MADEYEPDAVEEEDYSQPEQEADPADYDEAFDSEELGRLLDEVEEAEEEVGYVPAEEEADPAEYEDAFDDEEMERLLDNVPEEPDYDDEDDPEEQEIETDTDIDYTSQEFVDEDGLSFFLEQLKKIFFRYYSTSLTNLDTATDNGFYKYAGTATSAPTKTNGSLLVLRTSAAYQYQLAFPNNINGIPMIYIRIYYNSTAWSAWKTVRIT